MRISDWSSDVCSSDLPGHDRLSDERVSCRGAARPYRRRAPLSDPPLVGGHHDDQRRAAHIRSEEHTSELQSLMRSSYAVFCLKKKKKKITKSDTHNSEKDKE